LSLKVILFLVHRSLYSKQTFLCRVITFHIQTLPSLCVTTTRAIYIHWSGPSGPLLSRPPERSGHSVVGPLFHIRSSRTFSLASMPRSTMFALSKKRHMLDGITGLARLQLILLSSMIECRASAIPSSFGRSQLPPDETDIWPLLSLFVRIYLYPSSFCSVIGV